jgi:hypothetical protein
LERSQNAVLFVAGASDQVTKFPAAHGSLNGSAFNGTQQRPGADQVVAFIAPSWDWKLCLGAEDCLQDLQDLGLRFGQASGAQHG